MFKSEELKIIISWTHVLLHITQCWYTCTRLVQSYEFQPILLLVDLLACLHPCQPARQCTCLIGPSLRQQSKEFSHASLDLNQWHFLCDIASVKFSHADGNICWQKNVHMHAHCIILLGVALRRCVRIQRLKEISLRQARRKQFQKACCWAMMTLHMKLSYAQTPGRCTDPPSTKIIAISLVPIMNVHLPLACFPCPFEESLTMILTCYIIDAL